MLFWMIGSGACLAFDSSRPILVSILVVLDDWFGLSPAPLHWVVIVPVSILVVLDDWFGPSTRDLLSFLREVSILVVLDDWFGPGLQFER